jgi:hypothetical protein
MKVLLERERKNLSRARKSYEREVNQRTELEIFLRQCVRDVQIEISRRREELINTNPVDRDKESDGRRTTDDGDELPLSEFSSADRERVMELLLSQERVVSLLYSRTFPVSGGSRGRGAATEGILKIANMNR